MSDVLLATCEFRQPNPQLWLCVYVYPCVRVTVCVEKNTFRLLRVCVFVSPSCVCAYYINSVFTRMAFWVPHSATRYVLGFGLGPRLFLGMFFLSGERTNNDQTDPTIILDGIRRCKNIIKKAAADENNLCCDFFLLAALCWVTS